MFNWTKNSGNNVNYKSSPGPALIVTKLKEFHKEIADILVHTKANENMQNEQVFYEEIKSLRNKLLIFRAWLPIQDATDLIANFTAEIGAFLTRKINNNTFANRLDAFSNEFDQYKWGFLQFVPIEEAISEIFIECKTKNKIPQLFDQIVVCVEKISDEGHITNNEILTRLEEVCLLIKRGSGSDYFEFVGIWKFIFDIFKEYIFIQLEKIDGVGDIVKALYNVINKTDKAVSKVSTKVMRATDFSEKIITYNKYGCITDDNNSGGLSVVI